MVKQIRSFIVRYHIMTLFEKEMGIAGIADYGHLLKSGGKLREYDVIALMQSRSCSEYYIPYKFN